MVGKKKFNPNHYISPTQSNPHGSDWTHELDKYFIIIIIIIIIIKLNRKRKYKYKYCTFLDPLKHKLINLVI